MNFFKRLFGDQPAKSKIKNREAETIKKNKNNNSRDKSNKWLNDAVSKPHADHWVKVKITEFGPFSKKSTNFFSDNLGLESKKAIEMFKVMVAGQCPKCNGVISGEQILYVGACQQASGYLGTQEFFRDLVNGKCPSCSNNSFNIKWIGGNW